MFIVFLQNYLDFINTYNAVLILFFNIIIFNTIFMFFMKNPIYSLMLLILNYSLVSFIFIFNGVVFLGLVFMLVYVGAVSMLLIFTLMLLNLRIIYFKSSNIKNFYVAFYFVYAIQICLFVFINKKIKIFIFDDYVYINWFKTIGIKLDIVAFSYDLFINNVDLVLFISLYLTFILVATTSIVSATHTSKSQQSYTQLKVYSKKLVNK